MFSIFKKSKKRESSPDMMNSDLISKIDEMLCDDKLEKVFLDPVAKIYMFNMYTRNIEHLLNVVVGGTARSDIYAINIHSYFPNRCINLRKDLNVIKKHLYNNKLKETVESDVIEIVKAYELLK